MQFQNQIQRPNELKNTEQKSASKGSSVLLDDPFVFSET